MTLLEIGFILFAHWIADFVCQSDEMAKGKSKKWGPLLAHTFTVSMIMIPAAILWSIWHDLGGTKAGVMWVGLPLITFIVHTATDYYTSRVNSYLYEKGDIHSFFVSIGFDQLLHYAQLFLCFKYLGL